MFEELLRYSAPTPAASATPVFDATVRAMPLVYEPVDRGASPVFGPLGRSRPEDVSDIAWSEFEPAGWILDLLAAEHENVSSDVAAIEAVSALDRVISFATAVKSRYLATFARIRPPDSASHRQADPALDRDGNMAVSEFAGDEIAAALNLSRNAACAQLSLALDLTQRLPVTLGALETGAIDPVKAKAVAETTASLPAHAAKVVEEKVLLHAEHRTAAQLRGALRRAVIAVDPRDAQQRHEASREEHRVTLTPLDDGMAELWALLPADKAVGLYNRLTTAARVAKTQADPRGIDARRADALCELRFTNAGFANSDRSKGGPVVEDATPGNTASRNTMPQSTAARNTVGENTVGENTVGNDTHTDTRVQLQVTVSAATMLGLGEEPGHLTGYGPITADLVRSLAADATWRRILTDPATGQVLHYGRTTYRPPAALADHIKARDATCRFPGCGRPAASSDLDHVIPYDSGGTTDPENLVTLCRHHHRMKHHAGWRLDGNPNGTLTWFTPTGHRHQTYPAEVGSRMRWPARPEPIAGRPTTAYSALGTIWGEAGRPDSRPS